MINTNLPPILHRFQSKLWLIIGQIFASESGMPHFNALAGVTPANIAINDISLKLDPLAYIFAAESISVSSTTFTQSVPKATEFGEITRRLGLYAVQGHPRSPNLVPIKSSICDLRSTRDDIGKF